MIRYFIIEVVNLGKAIQDGRGYSYPEGTWIPLSKRYRDTLTQDGNWILLGLFSSLF